MYIMLPEETHRSPDSIIKYANRTRINMMKNAISFLKHFKGILLLNNSGSGGAIFINKYKSTHTLIYTSYTPMVDKKKIWCESEVIPNDFMFNMKYIAYYCK